MFAAAHKDLAPFFQKTSRSKLKGSDHPSISTGDDFWTHLAVPVSPHTGPPRAGLRKLGSAGSVCRWEAVSDRPGGFKEARTGANKQGHGRLTKFPGQERQGCDHPLLSPVRCWDRHTMTAGVCFRCTQNPGRNVPCGPSREWLPVPMRSGNLLHASLWLVCQIELALP